MKQQPKPERTSPSVILAAFIMDILIYLTVAWLCWGSAY